MSRSVLKCSLAILLAGCGTQNIASIERADQDAWTRASMACAYVGIAPGNADFNQCAADLQHAVWAAQNLYDN